MRLSFLRTLLLVVFGWQTCCSITTVRAADDLKPEAVLKSIENGKRFLLNRQNPDGSWTCGFNPIYPTGATSLAALALLNVGMTPQDPPMQRVLEFLRSQRVPDKTYEAGLQLMVFAA